MSNPSSPVSSNSDAFSWIGATGGSWGAASNWNDTTANLDPATTVPGATSPVTIAGAAGVTYEVITGGGAAASVGITNQVDLAGTYTFTGLTVGSETLVPNGYATFASGGLALGGGSTLNLGTLKVLDGQVTVGAGASVTASGAVSLGQPAKSGVPTGGATKGWSYASNGSLTVNGGGAFTASGALSVLDGSLAVDGSGSTLSVGGNLQLGSLAVAATATNPLSSQTSAGNVSLMDDGILAVTGSITDYDGASIYLDNEASFTAKGALTYDVGPGFGLEEYIDIFDNSTMRVADLKVTDSTSSGQSMSIYVFTGPGQTSSFEVGAKGGAAAGSITVDAGAWIGSTAGLQLQAGSIVDNGSITQTGGTLSLDAATSGAGSITLGAKSILEIGSSSAFNSSTDSQVYTPYAVSVAISGFTTGDGLILDNTALTAAVYTSTGATKGKLQLYVGATVEETLLLTGQSYTGDTFFISPTTNNGSEVTLLTPGQSHV